ncbi:tetratricopeptide (TPR) repeat protein [Paenibacillus anaericanus]|uniref:tetratricopeptide repeat protein n=1 Tax=Paenibacillus anaericanus TaxID=170367 RepID=UPI0027894273|nr:tetratricopeptide repeat protein [Paenibacillus anaericanus]MDQ0092128.1 tetratricopeptide (TPR) repeat protein [Paenibacillus anaericanus]
MSTFTLSTEVKNEWAGLMKEGYDYSLEGISLAAITIWGQLWDKMRTLIDNETNLSIEELDEAFFEQEKRISTWSSDFEMELGNASREESSFAQKRINFCSEYIARFRDQSNPDIELLKWAISESYFDLGQPEQGEKSFREQLTAYPYSGWGWIRWSDHYGVLALGQQKNSEKAVQILEQALEVEGLKDRYYVLERLEDLYAALGLEQKASAVKEEMLGLLIEDQDHEPQATTPNITTPPISISPNTTSPNTTSPNGKTPVPVTRVKVGRNDPCSCGSNKKYKKCCGSNDTVQ